MDPISVTFGQKCNFRAPKLVTFYYYELAHFLNWMKNTLLFIYSTNILERLLTVSMKNCLTPKIKQMRNPVTVTLDNATPLKSIRSWNATPSSGTFPLASKNNRASTKIAYKFSAPNVPISRRNKLQYFNWSIFNRKENPFIDGRKLFFLFIGREPTTWPANNCLQIMVCSCAMSSNSVWLQIIFCTCVKETVVSSFLRSLLRNFGRSLRFPRIFIKKNKLGDQMIKQLLNSVIAKYRDFLVNYLPKPN